MPIRPTALKLLSGILAFPMLLAACVGGGNGENADEQGSNLDAENGNDKIAFDYFVSKGLSDVQAAGIVGNLDQESGMSPTISQYGGGPGRGIAQWSAGGRWDTSYHDNVVWYASEHGASAYSLDLQLEFIWYELTTFGYGFSSLRAATNVTASTDAFMDDYEICGECDSSNRVGHAEAALADFGGSSSGGGGAAPDACSEPAGFCTETLQCLDGHWILRQDDPHSCTGYDNVQEHCNQGNGYCTQTLQCENGSWVPRSSDPNACTSGPG